MALVHLYEGKKPQLTLEDVFLLQNLFAVYTDYDFVAQRLSLAVQLVAVPPCARWAAGWMRRASS